jgi:hypothetical protein
MADTGHSSLQSEQAIPRSHNRMSWGAVLAGTAIAVAMSLLLGVVGLALGIGGLQVIHNVAQGADTITAGTGTGLWMIFSTLVSMALGGYVAGRLAGTFSHLDAELHGLTVWALTAMATAILLGQLVSAAISDVSRGIGPTAGAAIGTGNETGATVPRGQALIDRLQSSLSTGGDPAHMSRDQITAEINLLIDRRLTNGSFAPTERDRLITLLMHRDGIGHDEAALRITRLEQEASGLITRTRLAGANAVQLGARAVSASLLLGLMASLLGAWFGTRHVRRIAVEAPVISHVGRTVYEPPVHQAPVVHDVVPPRPAVFDITGLTLPATKADLLRQARTAGVEPALLAALERAADRRYMNIEDLLSELRVTAS